MGYETRIHFGTKSFTDDYILFWGTFDLCKMGTGPFSEFIFEAREKLNTPNSINFVLDNKKVFKTYIWESDGNTQRHKDSYGDDIIAIPVGLVIEALKQEDDSYRRVRIALDILESLVRNVTGSEELYVVIEGH